MRKIASMYCLLIVSTVLAHDQIPGPPQKQPIVIEGGTVHVIDGPVIQKGSVLFENGKVTAVGKRVTVPKDAMRLDASGKHVYPGLIESVTDIGLIEISAVDVTDDRSEYGSFNPNAKSWVAVNPDSELIPVARAGGVLAGMTAPKGRYLRGQSAVLYMDGWTVKEMSVLAPAAMFVDWSYLHPRDSDSREQAKERAEKWKELDDLLDEVRRYRAALKARPNATPSNVKLDSLVPLVDGKLPMLAQADSQTAIESAVSYAQSQGLKVIIYGGYEAVECADLLKRFDVPVIIGGVYRLPRYRDDPYDAAYTLPARLRKAGVTFSIAGSPGGASEMRNLPYHAGCAVAYGLPHDEALKAITLSAAEILGVAERMGSITVGKDATLIVADGDILETESNVTHAFIQGRTVDLGSRHKMLYEKYQRKYQQP
ncbi:MAG: amidohydrolase family protein [Planctomycetota bacterium]